MQEQVGRDGLSAGTGVGRGVAGVVGVVGLEGVVRGGTRKATRPSCTNVGVVRE